MQSCKISLFVLKNIKITEYMDIIAECAKKILPSQTLALEDEAKRLRKKKKVISFGIGEPDFSTPLYIKVALDKALRDNFTRYTSSSGIKELKEAICYKLLRDNRINYKEDEVIVTAGGKQGIYTALQAICNPEDVVLIPSPYWVSYPHQVNLVGTRVEFIPTQMPEFKLNSDLLKITLEKLDLKKNKAILILNSPANPTGSVYKREELTSLAKVILEEPNLYVISDEVYEKYTYELEHFSIVEVAPEIKGKSILVNSLSKSYGMTGWRVGYVAAEKNIIKVMSNIISHTTTCVTSFVQIAAAVAIKEEPPQYDKELKGRYRKRRDLLIKRWQELFPRLPFSYPFGTFYFFLSVIPLFKEAGFNSGFEVSKFLLEEAGVLVIPSEPFGISGYLRLSYAVEEQDLEEGLTQMYEAICKRLNKKMCSP
jgi:aspartate aminotransferase